MFCRKNKIIYLIPLFSLFPLFSDARKTDGLLPKQYEDSLFSQDKEKEKELNYLHLQQKLIENKQLYRENKLKQQEIMVNRLIILIVGLVAFFMVLLVLIVYRNNRRQKLLNLKLQKKNDDIATKKDRIEQQNKDLSRLNYTKDQLFSIISHDLRGPLASVQQAAELLCEGGFSEKEQHILFEGFCREITLVNNMVCNVLYWASSQQRGIKTNLSNIELGPITDEVLEVHEIIARNKGISIKREDLKDARVNADPDQVRVIIHNLIGNAIKFTPAGGTIRVFFTDDDILYRLHVKDTGVGITKEKINRLFRTIGKSISTRGTNSETGTGLGLVLVKQFTDANNGTLEVNSEFGQGTEFIVSFKKSGLFHLSE